MTTPTESQRQEYLRQVHAIPKPSPYAPDSEKTKAALARENLTQAYIDDPSKFEPPERTEPTIDPAAAAALGDRIAKALLTQAKKASNDDQGAG